MQEMPFLTSTYQNNEKVCIWILLHIWIDILQAGFFSSMNYIKPKYRSLQAEDSLQSCVKIKVTSYSCDIERLSS